MLVSRRVYTAASKRFAHPSSPHSLNKVNRQKRSVIMAVSTTSSTFKSNKFNKERVLAAMELAAYGDALGYKNGQWEFLKDTPTIQKQANTLGGIQNIVINRQEWPISDDTILHMSTAMALVRTFTSSTTSSQPSLLYDSWYDQLDDIGLNPPSDANVTSAASLSSQKVFSHIAFNTYRAAHLIGAMQERAPGVQTVAALEQSSPPLEYNASAGGNGGATRAMCIGLTYPLASQRHTILIPLAVRSCLVTHPNMVAIYGTVAAALMSALALCDDMGVTSPLIAEWPSIVYNELDAVDACVQQLMPNWWLNKKTRAAMKHDARFFRRQWMAYINHHIGVDPASGRSTISPPRDWTTSWRVREDFWIDLAYKSSNGTCWIGSSGHDAVLMAYNALTTATNRTHLLQLAVLHSGDNDSTATLALALFGALHGDAARMDFDANGEWRDVVDLRGLEYRRSINNLTTAICTISQQSL